MQSDFESADPVHDSDAEAVRLADESAGWRRWGPYLSERQWGTVREDYSPHGDAWSYFPHEQARSRAYRWGEDGIGGFGDERMNLCLSVALWNGRDPILKERLFGLDNAEGNHGEDVKELYYYLDGLPSHAYMRMLYKYPQAAYPYTELLEANARAGLDEREYELLDTGVFAEDRYFDVEIEYAKAAPDDLVLRITATNRGPDTATLWLAPQLVARNRWSWTTGTPRPRLSAEGDRVVRCEHPDLPPLSLHCDGRPLLLFCENETHPRLFGQPTEAGRWFKDGIGAWLIEGDEAAVNPDRHGTKMAALHKLEIAAGASASVRVLLGPTDRALPALAWDAVVDQRRAEADAWYATLQRDLQSADARQVHRQACAGLLWSKQYYEYDVRLWLEGDPTQPAPPPERLQGRNADWRHLAAADVLSVPDKWEYPWPATWDLALQCLAFIPIDPVFAKRQLLLLTEPDYLHPNGQMPAYEWGFGSANAPVHAWAAMRVFELDRERSATGRGDLDFLERIFPKLLLNFSWWVNRKDVGGRHLFQGGRLGFDNVSFFDRSDHVPEGGLLDQADGTGWVALFALALMRMALELARARPACDDLVERYFQHFLTIAEATRTLPAGASVGFWDDADGWCYDVLRRPGQPDAVLRVRSIAGLIPLCAIDLLATAELDRLPTLNARLEHLCARRPALDSLAPEVPAGRRLGLLNDTQVDRVLERLFDEDEFLSPYGIRSLSKAHSVEPARFDDGAGGLEVRYVSGEGRTEDTGGNSNWRGPVWMPVNLLIIEAGCAGGFDQSVVGDHLAARVEDKRVVRCAGVDDTLALIDENQGAVAELPAAGNGVVDIGQRGGPAASRDEVVAGVIQEDLTPSRQHGADGCNCQGVSVAGAVKADRSCVVDRPLEHHAGPIEDDERACIVNRR